MARAAAALLSLLSLLSPLAPSSAASNSSVGGYALINGPTGLAKMALLATDPLLPISRLYVGFLNPTMSYVKGSHTLNNTGLNLTAGLPGPAKDFGFAALATSIAAIRKAGVEVFLSLGGWDFSCFPMLYTRYSVGGYGPTAPNYFKIVENCGGSVDNASPANEFCYTCEPVYANESLGEFSIFPEPTGSSSWAAAVAYVTAGADPSAPPAWNPDMVPGLPWTDPLTGNETTVPGLPTYHVLKRDPYADFVQLALDLGVDGVDVDYEEMWMADYTKTGPDGGPWQNFQAVYKLAAIYKDVQLSIDAIAPHLAMSTAASAAGAWSGNWWGGNLKGVSLQIGRLYPDLATRILSNVMTYDLSDNEASYECPDPSDCSLDKQVAFYMNQFATNLPSVTSGVGYEVGTPAYPDPEHDPSHALPLTPSALSLILANTQPSFNHAFFWEIFKQPPSGSGEVTPTQLAQALCTAVLGAGTPRCAGKLPTY
jgi:hypothetical protein